jgi:hypothetical protein
VDRPVLARGIGTLATRKPDGYSEENEGLAQSVPEGQESGVARDGTIGERGEKDAEFDEDGTKLMPALRQIHKMGHVVPREKVAGEYSNQDIEDLDAGNQSFFNQPVTQRKTESDVGTQTSTPGGGGTTGDNPIVDDDDDRGSKPAPTKISKLGQLLKIAFELQGKMDFQGLPIAIENKAGSVRSGTDKDGHKWRTEMKFPYGYIESTEGADGEGVDCYVGPKKDAEKAYVVHQKHPDTGKPDEDKIMLGFPDKQSAKEAFEIHYDDPSKFLGPISEVSMDRLNQLVAAKGKLTKISAVTVRAVLDEMVKAAFGPMEMGPEPRGPFYGAPQPWQPAQPMGQPQQGMLGDVAQDMRSARKTVNLARKLWEARSTLPMLL